MRPKTELITSHIAALIKKSSKGRRQEKSISDTVWATGPGLAAGLLDEDVGASLTEPAEVENRRNSLTQTGWAFRVPLEEGR
jgi:hypothetical protein